MVSTCLFSEGLVDAFMHELNDEVARGFALQALLAKSDSQGVATRHHDHFPLVLWRLNSLTAPPLMACACCCVGA